jgi:hypothetical protein
MSDMSDEAMPDVKPDVKENLIRTLEQYGLADRVTFDDAAIAELVAMSSGDWRVAEMYAGILVLNALQNQKPTITSEDVKQSDPFAELVRLTTGDVDIWTDVIYPTTRSNLSGNAVEGRRLMAGFDADRTRDALHARKEGRLPKYAFRDRVRYSELAFPAVEVPFRYRPAREEIEAVAYHFARFVEGRTGSTQKVHDESLRNYITYVITDPLKPDQDPILAQRNYSVADSMAYFGFGYDVDGMVMISREIFCGHDPKLLQAYFEALRS